MGKTESRLVELDIELLPVQKPTGSFISTVRSGNLLFVSGNGPVKDGEIVYKGKVGLNLSLDEGYAAARLAALNCLSAINAALDSLDRVQRVVKVVGYVNSATDFQELPKVVNGASDLLVEVFGENGKHTRAAVGMASLPGGIAVEIEMIVELKPEDSL